MNVLSKSKVKVLIVAALLSVVAVFALSGCADDATKPFEDTKDGPAIVGSWNYKEMQIDGKASDLGGFREGTVFEIKDDNTAVLHLIDQNGKDFTQDWTWEENNGEVYLVLKDGDMEVSRGPVNIEGSTLKLGPLTSDVLNEIYIFTK